MKSLHQVRAHSKFSASGAERWINCPGSVALSEGLQSKPNVWSAEGTLAHEVLESLLQAAIAKGPRDEGPLASKKITREMYEHARNAADFILSVRDKHQGSDLLVEQKIHLPFIHPEMFGTFDGAVIDYFGTLHVFDFKYGAGHAVSVRDNLQMCFYAIGLAHKFQWNFKSARLWIIQPRIKGYDGPTFWELPILELKAKVDIFKRGVERVMKKDAPLNEGSWCHWCLAKDRCPKKYSAKVQKAASIFTPVKAFPKIKFLGKEIKNAKN